MSILLFATSAALLMTASIAFGIAGKGARRRLASRPAPPRVIPALVATAPCASYPSHTRILVMR